VELEARLGHFAGAGADTVAPLLSPAWELEEAELRSLGSPSPALPAGARLEWGALGPQDRAEVVELESVTGGRETCRGVVSGRSSR